MSLNITVTDQSPAFTYSPDRESTEGASWQSAWTRVSDANYDSTHTANNLASGVSSHVSSSNGASVKLDFVGTAITLYGAGSAGAYSTTLDGDAVSGGGGSVLATYGGLSNAKHTLTLQLTQSKSLTLSKAEITIRTGISSNSVTNSTQMAVTSGPNNTETTNSFFSTSGSGFSNEHQDQGYTRLDTYSSGSSITFTCSKTSALFVYGTSNWNHQLFSVELNPSTGASQGTRIFNATSKWFVLDNLVFFETGMDPSQNYAVKLTNLVDGSYSDIHSVVMMNLPAQADPSSSSASASGSQSAVPSSSSPAATTPASSSGHVGRTVGVAVAAVAAVAAVILFALFCWRRRRPKRKPSRMSRDAGIVTPFRRPPNDSDTLSLSSHMPMNGGGHYRDHSLDPYPHRPDASASATSSAQDFRGRDTGMSSGFYSSIATMDDLDPYLTPRANFIGESSRGSSSNASSGMPSPYQEKRTTRQASSSIPRQEVDAGPLPDAQEETLPPGYDPTWATRT
ncbi:hypothetical protein FB45DRAFT_904484 [Roridomyces roridus]|uniref:Uncharacterized protein n=1 Tax=Roridomyces roridus TaxID=1738132 RepID=A0AAD7C4S3_9AGAR|nr:hypothetical protein FB45DRAFT_904484 [Roridomyces roridus]